MSCLISEGRLTSQAVDHQTSSRATAAIATGPADSQKLARDILWKNPREE
jgi:hypothetical protein